MRWRVQLGINSKSDVWKFCQNWTNRRISMSKLDTSQCQHHILSPKPCCQTFDQNLVLLFVFSFSSFVKAKFGAFVHILI